MRNQIPIKKQTLTAKGASENNTLIIRNLGLDQGEDVKRVEGKSWQREHTSRYDTFCLHASEGYYAADSLQFTKQENYAKVNFWLSGNHTTVLDGFGQHEHDRPEAFLTAGPWEMLKMDAIRAKTQVASVSICFLPEFFPVHMGVEASDLPEPLRSVVFPVATGYAFHRLPLTTELSAAARCVLTAPHGLRQDSIYGRAKAVELMCLLIHQLSSDVRAPILSPHVHFRHQSRLYEAREILTRRIAEPITLEMLAREVGLNRMALTSGFLRLFGLSVYDYVHKERMERAHALLQDITAPIAQVAEAIGYSHACNFSTAFKAHFGYAPKNARGVSRHPSR
jgi:AraC-like DNA-binding protein